MVFNTPVPWSRHPAFLEKIVFGTADYLERASARAGSLDGSSVYVRRPIEL